RVARRHPRRTHTDDRAALVEHGGPRAVPPPFVFRRHRARHDHRIRHGELRPGARSRGSLPRPNGEVMDIRKVKKLIELLEESGISEIEISEGEESVRISRY